VFVLTSRYFRARYLRAHRVAKLQIGCGPSPLPGWLNTDRLWHPGAVFLDARQALPFRNATFDFVFTEHCLEHLSYRDGARLLAECYRILKPGGKVRVATPDLGFLVELYSPSKKDIHNRYIAWTVENYFPGSALDVATTPFPDIGPGVDTFVINNFFHAWGHEFIYDEKVLSAVLRTCGFSEIRRFRPGESDEADLRGVESHGLQITHEFNEVETVVLQGTRPEPAV
jgi:SAM-dependent methyltransferase